MCPISCRGALFLFFFTDHATTLSAAAPPFGDNGPAEQGQGGRGPAKGQGEEEGEDGGEEGRASPCGGADKFKCWVWPSPLSSPPPFLCSLRKGVRAAMEAGCVAVQRAAAGVWLAAQSFLKGLTLSLSSLFCTLYILLFLLCVRVWYLFVC